MKENKANIISVPNARVDIELINATKEIEQIKKQLKAYVDHFKGYTNKEMPKQIKIRASDHDKLTRRAKPWLKKVKNQDAKKIHLVFKGYDLVVHKD